MTTAAQHGSFSVKNKNFDRFIFKIVCTEIFVSLEMSSTNPKAQSECAEVVRLIDVKYGEDGIVEHRQRIVH